MMTNFSVFLQPHRLSIFITTSISIHQEIATPEPVRLKTGQAGGIIHSIRL